MAIITKKLQNIGISALENYSFLLTELIAEQPGIYALYKGDDLYYIGKAVDLKRRLSQHLKDRHHKKWDKFSLFIVNNEKHIGDLESLLITICEPKGNRQHPHGKAVNLENDFKKRIDTYRQEQDALLFGRKLGAPARKTISLQTVYKGKKYTAKLLPNGNIVFNKKTFSSPSAAGRFITGKISNNGLLFWKGKDKKGKLVPLKKLL